MKKLIASLFVTMLMTSAFASEVVTSTTDENLKVLDQVLGLKQTYSKTSQLEAKVIELLGGDGMNPTRMVLILSTGTYDESKTFELGTMVNEVTRITFLDKDLIVINYSQDSFDANDEVVVVKRSMKISVLRNEAGELTGEIKILD
jgi:hypothetical protein